MMEPRYKIRFKVEKLTFFRTARQKRTVEMFELNPPDKGLLGASDSFSYLYHYLIFIIDPSKRQSICR
jgi:hypothetical protein